MSAVLYYLGAACPPYSAFIPPQGPDGCCDMFYSGGVWAQTAIDINASGQFLCSAAYDAKHGQKGRIYLFGTTDSIVDSAVYDIATNTQTVIGQMPITSGIQSFAAVGAGKAWIFGGGTGTTNPAGGTGFVPTNGIISYDLSQTPGSGTTYVTVAQTLSYSAYGLFGATAPSGVIYFGGGCVNIQGPPTNTACFNQWQKFDPSAPANPTPLPPIPVKVCEAACAILSGVIYVIGGSLDGTPETIGTRGVHAYDIAGNSWSPKGNFPIDIACGRAGVSNGRLYCGGGWDVQGFDISVNHATKNIYVYDPVGDSWTLDSQMVFACSGSILTGLDAAPNSLFFGSGTTS